MQKMRVSGMRWSKILCRAALVCLLLSVLAAGALAEGIDPSRSVELSVYYALDDAPMADVEFKLYRVADVDAAGQFALAGQFAELKLDLNGLTDDRMRDLAQTLSGDVGVGGYAPDAALRTGRDGYARFGKVPTGLYLVTGETVVRGEMQYRPGATMVALPSMNDDGSWNYVVTVSAKQDVSALTHVKVVKQWEDEGARDQRPAQIGVALLKDGAVYDTQVLRAETGWQYEWTGLDARHKWNVAETPKLENYSVQVSSDGHVFTLINRYLPTPTPVPTDTPAPVNDTATPEPTNTPVPTTEVTGVKQWIDDGNAAGVRPEGIALTLYANGAATSYIPTWGDRSGDSWSYTFSNLPQVDEAGNAITYTVKESPVANYETTQSGTTITNRLIPQEPKEYIDVSGTKTWKNDTEEQRPASITVRLSRNGAVIEEKVVTAADGWKYSFTHLPMDDGYGNSYTYRISEKMVSGYYALVSGYDLTNVRVPDNPDNPDNPDEPDQPRKPGEPRKPRTPEIPPLPEEELEELIDIFDYGVPLWGGLLGTGDETPAYPYVFGGIGAAAVIVLLVFGRKKKKKDA